VVIFSPRIVLHLRNLAKNDTHRKSHYASEYECKQVVARLYQMTDFDFLVLLTEAKNNGICVFDDEFAFA